MANLPESVDDWYQSLSPGRRRAAQVAAGVGVVFAGATGLYIAAPAVAPIAAAVAAAIESGGAVVGFGAGGVFIGIGRAAQVYAKHKGSA